MNLRRGIGPGAYSAATHLIHFALIVALPLLLLVGVLLWRSVAQEREQLEQRVQQVLDALVTALDRDLDRQLTILQTLSTSPSLIAEDWAAFDDQARNSLRGKGYLVVIDMAGRQIINTYVPYGAAPATTGDPETLQRIRQVTRPVVSNVFTSLVVKAPVYNVSIPVVRAGEPRFILSLGSTPADLLALLDDQKMQPYWTTVIWDGKGEILARSREHARFVGTPVAPELRALPVGRLVRHLDLRGEDVVVAAARLKLSDWSIAVAYPTSLIDRQVTNSILFWAGTILMVGALVVGLAYFFGRDLAGPLKAATAAAGALGRGERIEVRDTKIVEVNAVITALKRAERDIDAGSAALRESEEHLRMAAEAAQFGGHEYDVISDRTLRSAQFLRLVGAGEGERTATFERGLGFVHPDDREATRQRKQQILAGTDNRYQLEYRIRRPDGQVRWVMDRGVVVRDPSGRAHRVVGVLLDISDLKASEQRQQLLLEELNHRVKNTLAIVQSLAQQTLRSRPEPRDFVVAFEARLASLARAHNLLTRDSWRGALLRQIMATALAPFIAEGQPIRMEGPPVMVPAGATITLCLMVHELATNAAKYGALSRAGGVLATSWTVTERESSVEIDLHWSEEGGPPTSPPQKLGFGSRLLAASARQLGGTFDIDYAPGGVRCRLRFSVAREIDANMGNAKASVDA